MEDGLIRKEILNLVKDWCEWTGKDVETYISSAVIERLQSDAEEVASYGIPRAKEFTERIKSLREV